MEQGPAVTVAALTYRRPAELGRLLPRLVEQANDFVPAAHVLIVDNDPDAGAAEQVSAWADSGVTYVHEAHPGISAGRNRAIDEATARGSAALVFIDDDEIPGPRWLAQMVGAWYRFGSAAVCGPVRSDFEHAPDDWVVATRVFERLSRPTGANRFGASSNNLLLDLEWLRTKGLRFDADFGVSGGSDTMLTHQITASGGEIRWCDEAEVIDVVPAARLTHRWVARRLIRTSNSWARVELKTGVQQGHGRRRWLTVATRVPYFLFRGFAMVATGTMRHRTAVQAHGVSDLCRAVGVAQAVVGFVNVGYRRS